MTTDPRALPDEKLREEMRRIYNECSSGTGGPSVIWTRCENCGGVVMITDEDLRCDRCEDPRVAGEGR